MRLLLNRSLLLLAAALLMAPASKAQQQAEGSATGLIVGRVVDGTNGAAVTGASVTIGGPTAPTTGNMVLVDSQGRFLFAALSAGGYTLTAQKNGFMAGAYGRSQPGGPVQQLQVRTGERVTDVTIRVWRYASISGRVVDEAGEPVPGMFVMAFRRTWVAGRPSLSGAGGSRATDDRGMYRLGRLAPGEYVVGIMSRLTTFPISFVEADAAAKEAGGAVEAQRSAELTTKGTDRLGTYPGVAAPRVGDFVLARSDGPTTPLPAAGEHLRIFPITFYPSASDTDEATPILLNAGDARPGIDLHLRLTPTVRISGIATGPDGPISNLGLRLQLGPGSRFFSRQLVEPAQTVTAANGEFTFFGVPPGTFTIVGAFNPVNGATISVARPITVGDRDINDVSLTLRPNARISGRIEFDGTSERPPIQAVGQRLNVDPVDGTFERVTFRVGTDGAIAPVSVPPGRYFIRASGGSTNALGPWTLKSAIVGGRDVSDVPMTIVDADVTGLVITFTDHAPVLSGVVRNTQNAVDPAAIVVVFPTDRSLWIDYGGTPRRLRTATPDRAGAFSISGLPEGEYFAIAVPEDAFAQGLHPKFLERAASLATRTTVSEGGGRIELVTRRWQ